MINQYDQIGEQGSEGHGLRVDLDLRGKEEEQKAEWSDGPRKKRPVKKRGSPKPLPPPPKVRNPLLESLQQQLDHSKRILKKGIGETVYGQLQGMEQKVFTSETNDNKKEYLNSIFQKSGQNRYLKDEIQDTLSGAQSLVQKDIKSKGVNVFNRRVPRNKNELKELERADAYRMIKIREGEVRGKVGNLKQDLDQVNIRSRIRDRVEEMDGGTNPQYFSIDHPRTKEAEQFVNSIQSKRKHERKKYDLDMSARRQRLDYEREREAQMKEMERHERRTKLKEYYDSKFQQRMKEKEMDKRKREEFQEWIQQYQRQRPLQAQKQEQYRMKYLIPELEERHKKLMTIKAQRKPIDIEEIAEHEQKYLQYKKDDQIRKRAEIQLAEEDDQYRKEEIDDRLYKGKYRMIVLEKMLEEKYPISSKEVDQSKKDRIKAYNSIIRQSAKTHVDRAPGQTLEGHSVNKQKFVRRVRNINGSMTVTNKPGSSEDPMFPDLNSDRGPRKSSEQLDPRKRGIQNLKFLKNLVREKVEKEEQNKPIINLIQQRQIIKPKGFLQVQREKKKNRKKDETIFVKEMQSTDITQNEVKANEQIGAIRVQAEMIDDKIKRQETRIRNNKDNNYQTKAQAQYDYVNAIKKKIQILDQFK